MKNLIKKLIKNRFVWFLIGFGIIPSFWGLRVMTFPTPKDAMGFVSFYEEDHLVFTFLGDHSYSLAFPGDEEKFKSFARRMDLDEHKISETEYREEDPDGNWRRGIVYDKEEQLKTIQYFSYSQ